MVIEIEPDGEKKGQKENNNWVRVKKTTEGKSVMKLTLMLDLEEVLSG